MREIKFQAYDEKNKVMVYPVAIYEDGHVGFSHDTYLRCYGKDFNPDLGFEPECLGEDWYYLLSNFKLRQYTGLLDKNGVEIYEGDIIRRKLDTFNYDKNHVVMWDELNACFYLGREAPVLFHAKEDEIIGNIYENGDLIK